MSALWLLWTVGVLDRSGTVTWTVSVELELVGFGSGLSRVWNRHAADPGEPVAEVTTVEIGTASVAVAWPGDERDALSLFFVQEVEVARVCSALVAAGGGA
jgi:hypothetical protein